MTAVHWREINLEVSSRGIKGKIEMSNQYDLVAKRPPSFLTFIRNKRFSLRRQGTGNTCTEMLCEESHRM